MIYSKIKVIFAILAIYFLLFVLFLKGFLGGETNFYYAFIESFIYLLYFVMIFILAGFLILLNSKFKSSDVLASMAVSFPVSLLMYFIFFVFCKLTGLPLNKYTFGILLFSTVAITILSAKKIGFIKEFSLKKIDIYRLIWGIFLVGLIFVLFKDKFILEAFSGDGSEHLEKALSLKYFFFPHLESEFISKLWVFSLYTPDFLYSFLNFFIVIFWGVSEAALRLPYLLFVFFLYYLLGNFIYPNKDNREASGAMLIYPVISIFLFLYTTIVFFYTSSSHYFVDIIDPSKDLIFTIFVLLQMYFLRKKKPFLFLLSAACSSLILYTGIIFTFLILFISLVIDEDKRKLIKWIITRYILMLFAGIFILMVYGYFSGCLKEWVLTFRINYFENKIMDGNSLKEVLLFAKYFLIFIGIAPVLVFIFIPKDKFLKSIVIITFVYFVMVMSWGHKSMHYFSPIAVMPILVFMMQADFPLRFLRNQRVRLIVLLVCILISLGIAIPRKVNIYEYARRFGEKTSITMEPYWQFYSPQAYEQGRAIDIIFARLNLPGVYVTWEKYARREIRNDGYFVFTDRPDEITDPEYQLLDTYGSVYFFAKKNKIREFRDKRVPQAKDFLSSYFSDLSIYQFSD